MLTQRYDDLTTEPESPLTLLRQAINDQYRLVEATCVEQRLAQAALPESVLKNIEAKARELVTAVREERLQKSGLDAFLYEYDLSSEEGIALMCLAEALLRVPDNLTAHQLIRDKVTPANWASHVGESDSFFVNAATWGLMLTGKILTRQGDNEINLANALQKFLERSSAPIIQNAIRRAMKVLGQQFVLGRNMKEAFKRGHLNHEKGYRHSFDMLGEAARTEADAERYFHAYQNAIAQIKKNNDVQNNVYQADGISIKLSALHPRYEFAQQQRTLPELIARTRALAIQARDANIGFTIDAEEADRLEISLDVIAALFTDPQLQNWSGFGLALQAYQKRAYPTLQWLIALARQQKRRLNVRLVKGAYWDYEIKDSQVKGLTGYPVFTRKVATDISYIACAKLMIAAPDAIYSQFATHNAYTVAAILELMGDQRDFEFQCLHGMGHALYDHLVGKDNIQCRIYAPVGTHEDLLAYLVRRLLENGANTSFVNRIIDAETPIKDLVEDPMTKIKKYDTTAHPKIPLPAHIFGEQRLNSQGLDLSDPQLQQQLEHSLQQLAHKKWTATIATSSTENHDIKKVVNPANHEDVLGEIPVATAADAKLALDQAEKVVWSWDQVPIPERAKILEQAADLFEQSYVELISLIIREAGKNIFDAIGEVREAIDACRYYAAQAKLTLTPQVLSGPTGEFNQLQMHGRGITVCISPWNFPLAIFTAQVVAALVSGNPVIAKPAEPTVLIAAKAVELLHQAGIPEAVLQLIPGPGSKVGAALIGDRRVKTIVFTGSTETARLINQTLAHREGEIPALIAETGGQNAMIVDSTALPEQVVADVIASAFNSAGQRCSALRILYLQEEIADKVITMLQGAMAELQIANPGLLTTDVGPVIDATAAKTLQQHVDYLRQQQAHLIYEVKLSPECQQGTFFAPRAYEIASIKILPREVFGPILHVIRYRSDQLDQVIADINSTGYGLTFGLHTRINERVNYIQNRMRVGNMYVNRNMIGAVMGVQPFGGEGLSGTGPKAGGPHYLLRFCVERTLTINTTASGGNASLMSLEE